MQAASGAARDSCAAFAAWRGEPQLTNQVLAVEKRFRAVFSSKFSLYLVEFSFANLQKFAEIAALVPFSKASGQNTITLRVHL